MAIASDQLRVFDRAAKRQQRNRAALRSQYPLACHLRDEIAWQLSDRVNDINRQFLSGLDLGCGTGLLGKHLDQELVKSLVQCDSAAHMLAKFHPQARDLHLRVECDEEALPFAPNTFDLVVSNLSLHWINDLPGTLQQVMKILKPDGVFIASLFGKFVHLLSCLFGKFVHLLSCLFLWQICSSSLLGGNCASLFGKFMHLLRDLEIFFWQICAFSLEKLTVFLRKFVGNLHIFCG
eukprot:m.74690 g.74690  ORF g.74690 m.74690 type:complete len:236 (-) comp17121_c0_seq2:179-886(-)